MSNPIQGTGKTLMSVTAYQHQKMSELKEKNKQKVMSLYMRGKYKEACDFVDSLYNWEPGEIGPRQYTKEEAQWCLKQL